MVELADLIVGSRCPACHAVAWGVCRACREELRQVPLRRVDRDVAGFPATWVRGDYAGHLRQLILAVKERGALNGVAGLAELVAGSAMAAWLTAGGPAALWVVPVPSAPARVRQRGVDVTGSIAAQAARALRRLGIAARPRRMLVQIPGVRDQRELSAVQRRQNLADALRVRSTSRTLPVLLVDDVVTTGATMGAAAQALRAHGTPLVVGAALAETVRHRPARPAADTGRQSRHGPRDDVPGPMSGGDHRAAEPTSPVRTRVTLSTGTTHTFPSPT